MASADPSTVSKNGATDKKRSRVDGVDGIIHFEENFTDPDVDNLRIDQIRALVYPQFLVERLPITKWARQTVVKCRAEVENIIQGRDSRVLVVVGPCSIHDTVAAVEYAKKLREESEKHKKDLVIIMRVYFEKPRTTVGWKGLINDPMLDNSFQINRGLHTARQLLLDINDIGLGVGCEFLDSMIPQYIADLVSWGAIGARTTESQLHRELASGLSMPVGFKNGTSGDIQVAVDACRCAVAGHSFLGITKQGLAAIVHSKGNADVHIILRGGQKGPNYDREHIISSCEKLLLSSANPRLVVDCSHGNSMKDHKRQSIVCDDLCGQIKGGEMNIVGVMIESHLFEGSQSLPSLPLPPVSASNSNSSDGDATAEETSQNSSKNTSVEEEAKKAMAEANWCFHNTPKAPTPPRILDHLRYGVSITDQCISWEDTVKLLKRLSEASALRKTKI